MTPADLRELAAILNEAADRAEKPEPAEPQATPGLSEVGRFLKPMLELHEGRSRKLYQDSKGIWSIAVGYNIQEHGLPDDIIDELLRRRMAIAVADARAWLGEANWDKLDLARKVALGDFSYNVGATTLAEFRATRAKLIARDYAGAANNMMASRWADQVGSRAPRITEMIRTGELPTDVPGLPT